jgi:hypothetical protein
MATSIGPAGLTFSDGTTDSTAGATGVNVLNVFTSPGTWTKAAGLKAIKVTVVGGGGTPATTASGPNGFYSAASGGGGGGSAIRLYPAPSLSGPQPYAVGGAGETSSFGVAPATVISATGGAAGATGVTTITAGGAGGVGSGGVLNMNGNNGGSGQWLNNPIANCNTGTGGDSILGAGGMGVFYAGTSPTAAPGAAGTGYGGGGAGGRGPVATGGTGASGVVIVEEFY